MIPTLVLNLKILFIEKIDSVEMKAKILDKPLQSILPLMLISMNKRISYGF